MEGVYRVPHSTGWGLKPPLYLLQALSLYIFIQLRWAKKARIIGRNTWMLFLSYFKWYSPKYIANHSAEAFLSPHTLSGIYSLWCFEVANLMNVFASLDFDLLFSSN